MRILLFGAGGQLAEDLRRAAASEEVIPVSHSQVDIGDGAAVAELVAAAHPQCVVNTAAFNQVDACEDRPEEAFRTNTVGVLHLARAAQAAGATLVHFSTNYVFDGAKRAPYVETDPPNPISVYAYSKAGGEWAARTYCEKHLVIRTAALFGRAGNRSKGGNFVERIIRAADEKKPLRIVNDQMVNPTGAADLALVTMELIRGRRFGICHAVNSGASTWFDFAREVFRILGRSPDLQPTSSEALAAKARRPAYSALENRALREAGVREMRPWQEALAEYLSARSA